MSYDLYVWKAPIPPDEGAFLVLRERFQAGDASAFEPSQDLVKFRADLLKRYPALEDLDDDKVDDSPWSMTPEESDRLIELTISWDDAEKMVKEVAKLAKSHRLAMTDSASGVIVRP